MGQRLLAEFVRVDREGSDSGRGYPRDGRESLRVADTDVRLQIGRQADGAGVDRIAQHSFLGPASQLLQFRFREIDANPVREQTCKLDLGADDGPKIRR